MREDLRLLCSNFINNRDIIKAEFFWESTYLYPVCAAIFTDKRKTADAAYIKQCNDILKAKTGIFSNFRSTAKLPMVAMMAVDGNPESKLTKALQVYDSLKEHFFSSQYLPVASMIIADLVESVRYGEIAARTRKIYNLMKSEHPFLTSGEDSVFASLLALSELTEEQIVRETEKCYQILKPEFFSSNAVQSLSHVLALGEGSAEVKCKKTMDLFYALKNKGHKYGTDYELATLGVLAMLDVDKDVLVDDIIAVDDFLSKQKGYGILGIGRKQRLMHAGMIVTSSYVEQGDNLAMNSAAIGGTISLIAAQQAAMCAAIAASSAAAASSSSGGN